MIKIDLVTGFLGSGKTTFIREYARFLMDRGERIAIIENDYGAVNVDMVLLQDLIGENCNLEMIVGGDGKEAHARRFRTKLISMGMSGYTRVIIEPSGIYDADEFFDVLYDEPLDRWYEIGSVISIVDAVSTTQLTGSARYLFMSETAWAGKLILSKVTDDTDVSKVAAFVNDTMEEYGCSSRYDQEKDIIAKPFNMLTEKDFLAIQNAGYKKSSYTKLDMEDRDYTPLFYFDVEMPRQKLEDMIKSLFRDEKAGHIIRIKGFVRVDESTQLEVNATEKEIRETAVSTPRNIIIIIGEGLNKEYINDLFRDYCSQVSL